MDVHVYGDGGDLWLKGPECRSILTEIGETALALWRTGIVAHISNRLAKSGYATVVMGGVHHDRWVGELHFGQSHDPGLLYGPAYEFGHQQYHSPRFVPGAHDLNAVLEELGAM